jgi:SAM-dependent methyltransferase
MKDPTARFSDRVSDYVKYRPHYPAAMVRLLEERIGLRRDWAIADIGSGTGISSEGFLELGCEVTGVEPNRAMREAAEALFAKRPNFRSLGGRAEATLLPSLSVDLYVSGQAFHWFDRPAARVEALRILREPKRGLLMWNDWRAGDSPFLRDYDALLSERMPERAEADHRNLGPGDIDAFFGALRWEEARLRNAQVVDFEGLKGRLLSASYAPKAGDPRYEETIAELREIFDRHAAAGFLDFGYETILYFGEIAP